MSPLLIVNADDLGYDAEIDRGILEAHRLGLVTSASAMVEGPSSERALAEAPASLGLGLHAVLEVGLGRDQAEAEVSRQAERFERLRGAPPTHLDTHRHAHASPALLEAVAAVALRRRLPVRAIDEPMRRELRRRGVATSDHFLGDAALRPCWTRDRLLAALAGLADGVTELMCHPGHAPSVARTSFGREREIELAALCDPAARASLPGRGVRLARYAAGGRLWRLAGPDPIRPGT